MAFCRPKRRHGSCLGTDGGPRASRDRKPIGSQPITCRAPLRFPSSSAKTLARHRLGLAASGSALYRHALELLVPTCQVQRVARVRPSCSTTDDTNDTE